MATIVTQYDPWREKLAANLGIGLLSDALSRGREADANRKNNALYTKTLEDLGLLGEQTQQFADPLMNSQALPDGYNDNGWAKTMHDSYTPMTQFNMGTAGLTEPAPQPKIPTQMDMMRALAANIAGPRFNSVNFNDVYTKMFKPTMDAATADYATQLAEKQRAMQQQYADALFGAQGRYDMGKNLMRYIASGYAQANTANAMQQLYGQMNPPMKNVLIDAGGTIYPASFNTADGSYNWPTNKDGVLTGIPVTNNPDKADELSYRYANMYNANEQNALDREQKQAQLDEIARHNQATERNNIYKPDFFAQTDYKSVVSQLDKLSTQRIKLSNELAEAQNELEDMKSSGAAESPYAKTLEAKINSLLEQKSELDKAGQFLETERQRLKPHANNAGSNTPKDAIFDTPLPVNNSQGHAPVSMDISQLPILQTAVANDDIRPVSSDLPFNDPLAAKTAGTGTFFAKPLSVNMDNQQAQAPQKAPKTKAFDVPLGNANTPKELLVTPQQFNDLILRIRANKRITTEQAVVAAIKHGYKINPASTGVSK